MKRQFSGAVAGLALLLSSAPSVAGPCTRAVANAQAEFDARLAAAAAAGPAAAQSKDATAHHQPTPKSIADAEENLGELSHDQAHAFGEALQRARTADSAGTRKACDAALSDAKAALKN